MSRILKQEYIITSPFDEKMAIEGISSQLSSQIFDDLIQNEKFGIKLTFTLETIDEESKKEKGDQ